eukprot:05845_5
MASATLEISISLGSMMVQNLQSSRLCHVATPTGTHMDCIVRSSASAGDFSMTSARLPRLCWNMAVKASVPCILSMLVRFLV